MKNLKHYFVPPKRSSSDCDLVSRDSACFGEASVSNSNSIKRAGSVSGLANGNPKKKKRKRKDSSDFDEKPVDSENISLKIEVSKVSKDQTNKRAKSVGLRANNNTFIEELLVTPEHNSSINSSSKHGSIAVLTDSDLNCSTSQKRKSSRKRQPNSRYSVSDDLCSQKKSKDDSLCLSTASEIDKNSLIKQEISKENTCKSENEDKLYSTPENTKSLLNYFNKVDKLPEIENGPRVIKVEAMVHIPSSGSSGTSTPKSIKKRKSGKKKVPKVDYDLITLEETDVMEANTTPSSSGWKMRIQIADESSNSVDIDLKTQDIVEDVILKEEVLSGLNKNVNDVLNKDERKKRKLRKSDEDKIDPLNKDEEKKIKLEPESSTNILLKKKPNENKEDISNKKEGKKRKLEPDLSDMMSSKKKPIPLEESEVEFVSEIKKEKPKVKNGGTLASFFQIGRKTPALSSEQKLAKQAFLSSGAPDLIKRITDTKHNNDFRGKDAPYPGKSHIQQKDKMNILWNLHPKKFNFCNEDKIVFDLKWSSILPNQLKFDVRTLNESQTYKATSLSELKKELNLYPISCWSKELKKLKKGKENIMWSERYRPHLGSAFLANTRNISKLKAWLTELKENSRSDSAESSGDEFVKDDDNGRADRKTVVLLSGLPGTGKTAAVYAIAEEIGYHVLEINASYNRSGKRLLNEFSEAMQSHKVGVSKLNFSKAKKNIEDPKRSLVLVEDADLLFEDDDGFVPTLITLAAGTKRPMILVVNNSQTKHLSKLIALCHASLHFTPPSQDRLGSWLRTISAVEGFSLTQTAAAELASTQDIRRSLLQLQFSKEKVLLNRVGNLEESIWQRIGEYNIDSVKEMKKAKIHMSSLATLDIIRYNKKSYTPAYWQSSLEDGTSTHEYYEIPGVDSLEEYESYFLKLMNVKPKLGRFQQIENPRNLNEIEKSAFSLTNILSRRNSAMDLWPSLRQISRNEVSRLASHTKRNNRYFNYLSSVGISGPPDFMQSLSSTFNNFP